MMNQTVSDSWLQGTVPQFFAAESKKCMLSCPLSSRQSAVGSRQSALSLSVSGLAYCRLATGDCRLPTGDSAALDDDLGDGHGHILADIDRLFQPRVQLAPLDQLKDR